MDVAMEMVPAAQGGGATGFMDKLLAWQMPTQQEYVGYLSTMGSLQAALCLGCGLLYLLQGWKVFKILVVVNAAILGAIVGTRLGSMVYGQNMPVIAGALLTGALALPLMKYAVSLMGGLAGAALGYGIWHHVANAVGAGGLAHYAWAGALVGLVTMGLLAFIILRETIIVFTTLQGAFLAVTGLLSILLSMQTFVPSVTQAISGNHYLLPLLVLVPAVIGFTFQHSAGNKKGGAGGAAKKPAPA